MSAEARSPVRSGSSRTTPSPNSWTITGSSFSLYPQAIRFDNGPEFTSRAMLQWAATESIDLQFIQPGKPTQNAQVESLNGRVRDELLNAHTFRDIQDARHRAECWRQDYNEIRPHSSLGYRTRRSSPEPFQSSTLTVMSCAKRHLTSTWPRSLDSVRSSSSARKCRSILAIYAVR